MAIYIQTPNGLYPIGGQTTSGKVTKSKIIEALGYTPSAFDGDYNSLNNKPEIIEDGSDNFYIVDTQGNIIFKVDSNGIHSVNLTLDGKTINELIQENTPSGDYNDLENRPEIIEDGSDELTIIDTQGNIIFKVDSNGIHSVNLTLDGKTINELIQESTPNVGDGTSGEDGADGADGEDGREVELQVSSTHIQWRYVGDSTWTNLVSLEDLKGDAGPSGTLNTNNTTSLIPSNESLAGSVSLHRVSKTGDYNSLNNKPEILEDASDELSIVDSQGNIVARITSEGIQAVNFLVGADEVALAKDISSDYELTKTKIDTALVGSGTNSIQLGNGASATESSSIVLGAFASASGGFTTAVGRGAKAIANDSTAVGRGAKAEGFYSTSLGSGSESSGNCSIALGLNTSAKGNYSIALGTLAVVDGENSISLGYGARAEGLNSIAIGTSTEVTEDNVVDFGSARQVRVNETPANDRDAVSKKYLESVIGEGDGGGTYELTKSKIETALKSEFFNSLQLGKNATAVQNSTAFGFAANASGASSIALGHSTTASNTSATALGHEASAEGTGSTAIGQGAKAPRTNSTAVGFEADASGANSIAIGRNASTSQIQATALGEQSSAGGVCSIALGSQTTTTGQFTTALGHTASARGYQTTAVGYGANTGSVQDRIQLGNTDLASLQSNVQLTVTSDIRDKADIEEVPKALDFIKDLNPITYVGNDRDHYISDEQKKTDTYKDYLMVEDYDKTSHSQGTKKGSRRRVGLSAQEVRDKLIEHYGSDNYANVVNDNFVEFEERGLDIPKDLENKLTMSYETMVPFLIKAIQEQQEQIEELKKQINNDQ